MFIVFLRFSENKAQASAFMNDHNAWIQNGFDDGVFLVSGSLKPSAGGAVLAHGTSLAELEARVAEDPFVAKNVVAAEIIEITPGRTNDSLAFLLD